MTIEALWTRLEAVAQRHGKTLRLRPGASEAAIAAAEVTMKLAIPADYRASLALHDGQDDSEYDGCFPWMPGCFDLTPRPASPVSCWKTAYDESGAEDA